MEVGSIHNQANHSFERASSFRQSMHDLKREIKAAKAEQKYHASRAIQLIASFGLGSHDDRHTREVSREFNEVRHLTRAAREREHKVRKLDVHVRSAVGKAHILIDLARKASVGRVYAKHQADIMLGRQPKL